MTEPAGMSANTKRISLWVGSCSGLSDPHAGSRGIFAPGGCELG